MPLTNILITDSKHGKQPYKLSDSGGLFLLFIRTDQNTGG